MKIFDPLEEIAKKRAAEAKAKSEGKEASKVSAWLDPEMYTLPDKDDEDLGDLIAESKARKKRIKDMVK
jgi:hypothetical protein